ncbi:carbohydrate ABC transporter permease [Acutalibacter caecimuris]|uniref:carbohydrate ABC transporter permease n=1 Tax=Acutalibacter caecimuris TaxID=3093657 RepID=UPI002AC9C51B|nr:sugar ABC transporter permease [Acutalibacter sp. M00118]
MKKKSLQKCRREWAGLLFVLPSLLGVSLFVLVPFLDVVRRSFVGAISEQWVGLGNYAATLGNPAFQLACKNTLRFVGVCIPALLLLSLLVGVFLQREKQVGPMLKTAFLFPMAIPVASVALVWQVLFHENGIVNGLLDGLGVNPIRWMNSPAAFWVLVGSYLWKNLGYDIVLWMAGLSGIPDSLYEAARIDGAGEWRLFRHITLPSLLPTFATVTVLSLLNSFKVFREAYLVGGDYPHESMYLLQHLFNNWFRDLSFDRMAAGAVMVCGVILLLIFPLQNRLDREG